MKRLVIIASIIVLVAFGAFYFHMNPQLNPGDKAASTAPLAATSSQAGDVPLSGSDAGTSGETAWKTYENDEYAFRLKYPPQYRIETSFPSFYHVSNGWMQDAFAAASASSTEKALARILVNEKKSGADEEQYYYDAELRVGASRDASDVESCLISQGALSSSTVRINGADFTVFEESQAGMSQSAQVESYRTISNGACIVLESIVTLGGTGTNAEAVREPSMQTADKAAIESMIKTFSFQ